MALGGVGVEQGGGSAVDDGGELAAEADRVAEAEVESLPAGWGVDVRGVPGEQHPPAAVGAGLAGGVGVAGGRVDLGDRDAGAADPAQALLHLVWRDRRVRAGLGAVLDDVHPRRPALLPAADHVAAELVTGPARRQLAGIVDVDNRLQAGELRAEPGESEPAVLAHQAVTAVTPGQPAGPDLSLGGSDRDGLAIVAERGDRHAAADFGSLPGRVLGEDRLQVLLRDDTPAWRAGAHGRVDQLRADRDAREMPGERRRFGV